MTCCIKCSRPSLVECRCTKRPLRARRTMTCTRNGSTTTSKPSIMWSWSQTFFGHSNSIPKLKRRAAKSSVTPAKHSSRPSLLRKPMPTPEQAQVVAAECVTLAETKDHLNWELAGEVVKHLTGEPAKVLRAAYKEVEDEEDKHLYHNTGWARELWIEGLGLPAVLPPPEEQKEVKTAIGAARAKQARKDMA